MAPIAAQRLVTGDALGKQQSLDAIDVLDPLGDQHFALAAEAAPIFFLWRRRFHHRAQRLPPLSRRFRPFLGPISNAGFGSSAVGHPRHSWSRPPNKRRRLL